MTDETKSQEKKPKRKILRILGQIVRWMIIVPLAILLILAIIFQAAWKITLLLAILVAGLMLIPKAYRKWFYLSIAAVVLALTIWVFLPDNNEGWQPYTFDEEIAAFNAKYHVPDEKNAAAIYKKLVSIFDDPCVAEIFEDCNTIGELRKNPWTKEQYPEYAQWLEDLQYIIDLLLEINNYQKCYFPISANPIIPDEQFIRISTLRRAAYLSIIAANYDIAEDKLSDAITKYKTTLRIGEHFQRQPDTINKLVGMAIESLGLSGLEKLLINQNPSDEQLKAIEKLITVNKYDWSKWFTEIIEYEKQYHKGFIANYYEINPEGKTRFARDPWQQWREEYKESLRKGRPENSEIREWRQSIAYPYYLRKKLWKANTIFIFFCFPTNPQSAVKIIDREYEKLYSMVKPDYEWSKLPKSHFNFLDWPNFTIMQFSFKKYVNFLTISSTNSYHQIRQLFLRLEGDRKGSLLLAALKKYKNNTGDWPENLSEIKNLTDKENLIDPRSNSSFVYKKIDDGFLLYSIGPNKIDEKGNSLEPADDWPIWPTLKDEIWDKFRDDANDK